MIQAKTKSTAIVVLILSLAVYMMAAAQSSPAKRQPATASAAS